MQKNKLVLVATMFAVLFLGAQASAGMIKGLSASLLEELYINDVLPNCEEQIAATPDWNDPYALSLFGSPPEDAEPVSFEPSYYQEFGRTGGCLIAETLVLSKESPHYRMLDEIEAGDRILSMDVGQDREGYPASDDYGSLCWGLVRQAIAHETNNDTLVTIMTQYGSLYATSEHPFFVATGDGYYQDAFWLTTTDSLMSVYGVDFGQPILDYSRENSNGLLVYELEMSAPFNFFVFPDQKKYSDLWTKDPGVLVHNIKISS